MGMGGPLCAAAVKKASWFGSLGQIGQPTCNNKGLQPETASLQALKKLAVKWVLKNHFYKPLPEEWCTHHPASLELRPHCEEKTHSPQIPSEANFVAMRSSCKPEHSFHFTWTRGKPPSFFFLKSFHPN